MQTANHLKPVLTFDEAVNLAIDMLPGLRHDLAQIQKRRKDNATDMQGIGRVALNIPDPIIPLLQEYHPELYQEDQELAGRAWLKFINSRDAERFRTNARL